MKQVMLVIAAVITLSSCASIFGKTSSEVRIESHPDAAKVEIWNRKGEQVYNGRSPAYVRLKHASGFFKRAEYKVKLSLDGYESREVTIHSSVYGWYWGNFLIGGILGFFIIDPATGAMYKLDTKDISETLAPLKSTSMDVSAPMMPTVGGKDASGLSLNIISLKDVPENLRSKLVKL